MPKTILLYQTEAGKEPFSDWFKRLDSSTRVRVRSRLDRVEQGHYGDYKAVGEGVFELRLFFGSGYRIYFAEDGDTLVLLLCAGDKGSQSKDISRAQSYYRDCLALKSSTRQTRKED